MNEPERKGVKESISLDQLSKLAGVSKTTVSLVLNGKAEKYRIAESTQKKIHELVKEYGYRPDFSARAIRMNRSSTLGLIVPDLENAFFAKLATQLEHRARENDYQLLIASSEGRGEIEEEIIENFLHRKVDGLLISSVIAHHQHDIQSIPVVYIDREVDGFASVTSANEKLTYELIRHQMNINPQQFALIGGTSELSTERLRRMGFTKALQAAGHEVDDRLILEGDFTTQWGEQAMGILEERCNGLPDAIFITSSTLLFGVLRFLFLRESKEWNRINLCTFDDHPMLDYLPLKVNSVRQNTNLMAEKALKMMLDSSKPSLSEVIDGEIIIRDPYSMPGLTKNI